MLELTYGLLFAITVLASVMVVLSRHAVYSALYLVTAMISIAGIFILINAQLAAVLQILVYAGAIMVLFLFVIMLLNLGHMGEPPIATRFVRRLAAPLFLILLLQVIILAVKYGGELKVNIADENHGASVGEVAMILLTRYLYAFEMTSVMLLIAVVGAMTLARRKLVAAAPESGDASQGRII